jgi:hypothetical protein
MEQLTTRITGQTPLNQLFLCIDGEVQGLWEHPDLVVMDQAYRWETDITQALEPEMAAKSKAEQLYWFAHLLPSRIQRLDSLGQNLNQCLLVNRESRTARFCLDCEAVTKSLVSMAKRLRGGFTSVLQTRREAVQLAMKCAHSLVRKAKRVKRIVTHEEVIKREPVVPEPVDWDKFVVRRSWLQQVTQSMDVVV